MAFFPRRPVISVRRPLAYKNTREVGGFAPTTPTVPAIEATVARGYDPPKLPNRSRLYYVAAPATPQTINVSQASETDTANAVTVVVTQNTASFPIKGSNPFTADPLPNRSRLVGSVSVSVPPQTISVNQALETDSANAVTVLLTQHPALFVDQIQPYTAPALPNKSRLYARYGITIAVGQALETDTATAVTLQSSEHPSVQALKGRVPYTADPLPNKTRLYARYGITVAVGQALETDTANSISIQTTEHPSIKPIYGKTFTPVQVPNQSRIISRPEQIIAVGQALETDSAFAVTVVVTQATTINAIKVAPYTADPLPNKSRLYITAKPTTLTISVNQALETDTANSVTVVTADHAAGEARVVRGYSADPLPNRSRLYARIGYTIAVAQALETDTAAAVTVQTTDHPSIQTTRAIKAYTPDPLPNKSRLYARSGITVAVGQALETDTANAVTLVTTEHPAIYKRVAGFDPTPLPNRSRVVKQLNQTIPVGQALETDFAGTAGTGTETPSVKATRAKTYTNPPLPNKSRLYARYGITVPVGQASETDTAGSVTSSFTEHPSVQATRPIKAYNTPPLPNRSRAIFRAGYTIPVGQALETDTAQTVTASVTDHAATVLRAIKAYTAEPLRNVSRLLFRRGYQLLVGQATETETANSVKANQTVHCGQAIEVDTAAVVIPLLGTGVPIINRGRTPFNSPQVPNLSRFFEIIRPDIVAVGPTFTSGGVRPNRIVTEVDDGAIATEVRNTRATTQQGDVTIDAKVRRNRIIGDS